VAAGVKSAQHVLQKGYFFVILRAAGVKFWHAWSDIDTDGNLLRLIVLEQLYFV